MDVSHIIDPLNDRQREAVSAEPGPILVLAGAMGVQQMGLAQEIVNLAFAITLGALAVAGAIAFGIGGRDAAKTLVDDLMKSRRSGP